jgi:nonribosomal peptide synthetase MxcG
MRQYDIDIHYQLCQVVCMILNGLTQAQLGIWLGDQRSSDPSIYNCAELHTIVGPFDPRRFEEALLATLRAASALHSRFVSKGGVPFVETLAGVNSQLEHLDLSEHASPEAALRAYIAERLTCPLRIDQGRLFEHTLIDFGGEKYAWLHIAHHIALDGFGFHLISESVSRCYEDSKAELLFLPLAPVQKADALYENSQQKLVDEEFWLKGVESTIRGKTLHAYRSFFSEDEALTPSAPLRVTRRFSKHNFERLRTRAAEFHVSWPHLNIALVAAFVCQSSGEKRFALGIPLMQRLESEGLKVPCTLMNIVRLPLCLRENCSLAELSVRVRELFVKQSPHQRFRYEHLKYAEQGFSVFGPVVNTIPFAFPPRFGGCKVESEALSAGPVEDLSVLFLNRGEELELVLDGHPRLYSKKELERLAGDFSAFALECLERPHSLLPTKAWEGGANDVVSQIEAGALARPAQSALEEGEDHWTYAELWAEISSLAESFAQHGAQAGDVIAIDAKLSARGIIALLAALACGCGYVALDPEHPSGRRTTILERLRPALVVEFQKGSVESSQLSPRELPDGSRRVRLDEKSFGQRSRASPSSLGRRRREILPTDVAYIVFTSGSTGEPKGVVTTHASLSHFARAAGKRYGLLEEDRVLGFAPLTFDTSVEEIFVSLTCGATLVVRIDEMLTSMRSFASACEAMRITILDLPTAFWHEFVWAMDRQGISLPSSVRTTIIGGEAALPERVAIWRDLAGHCRLQNSYGPSESTVVALVADLSDQDPSQAVAIGTPLDGVQALLLDQGGELVSSPGEIGEIYLAGPTVSPGYFERDDLTRRSFSPLPRHGVAWSYRTGDLARFREDGQLVFVGRVDNELKVSGYRISPMEIEVALDQHPEVRGVAVTSSSALGRLEICAHVECEGSSGGATLNQLELRSFLQSRLPPPMIPTDFRFYESLPRTSSGKLDRVHLSSLTKVEEEAPNVSRYSPMEKAVAEAWKSVLGGTLPGLDDNFFHRGGQSLQAISVVNRLSHLKPEITVAVLFQNPILRSLAASLENSGVQESEEWKQVEIVELGLLSPTKVTCSGPPQRILLTGATGFVGVHLLHALLRSTEAQLLCLVRAESDEAAKERVLAALARHRLEDVDLGSRLACSSANLSESHLEQGLPSRPDLILHCAAEVSLTRDFSSLKPSNVESTLSLLKLAARIGASFHFVSTLATAPRNGFPVPEEFFLAHSALRDGYQRSKWYAERLCEQALSMGLNVSVYRLGRITAARDHLEVSSTDILWRTVRASLRCGAWPELDIAEVWTPADDVARIVVKLLLHRHQTDDGDLTGIFHLAQGGTVHLGRVRAALLFLGRDLELLSLQEWCAVVKQNADLEDLATLAFFELGKVDAGPQKKMGEILATKAARILGEVQEPSVSDELIRSYCRSALRRFEEDVDVRT